MLAFAFGYAFTMAPLLRNDLAFADVVKLALAANTVSVALGSAEAEHEMNGTFRSSSGAM